MSLTLRTPRHSVAGRFLLITPLLVALTIGPGTPLAAATPTVINVQVNQALAGPFPRNKQNEPSLAQNSTKPLNLIAGSNDEIGLPACTNTTPSSCPFTNGVSVSGFYASFDSRGNAYYGTLAFPNSVTATHDQLATGLQADFFVAKSTDGGCHYTSAARVSGAAPAIFDDKDAITADANPSSPFH